MLTPRVSELPNGSRYVPEDQRVDRELRCRECGTRMFSSRGPDLLDSGLRCSRCRGTLELMPDAAGEAPV